MKLPEVLFALALALASVLLYFFRPELGDTRRWVLTLVAIGFFFAPLSAKPLHVAWWLSALAAVCWGASLLTRGTGGLGLWMACSLAGAFLCVRAGSRAARFYLPAVGAEMGTRPRSSVRRALWMSVALFLVVFMGDGWAPGAMPLARGMVLFASAAFFMRFLLLQSDSEVLLLPGPLRLRGPHTHHSIVVAQRWPLLVLLTVSGATRLPDTLLEGAGSSTESLLVSSILLLVLGALLFVISLVRLEAASRISRGFVRRTSFVAGMALAVALAAVVVELEAWGPSRFTSFGTICTFALIVLPFAHETMSLFGSDERFDFLFPPAILAVILAPVSAINGDRWQLASTGFLLALAALMLVLYLVLSFRRGERGTIYLAATLVSLVLISMSDGTSWSHSGGVWKTFWIAVGCVLYAVDLLDRSSALPDSDVIGE